MEQVACKGRNYRFIPEKADGKFVQLVEPCKSIDEDCQAKHDPRKRFDAGKRFQDSARFHMFRRALAVRLPPFARKNNRKFYSLIFSNIPHLSGIAIRVA